MQSAFLGFGSEQALRHIADELADGLFTTDAEGRITYWNGAAQRITGWSAAEALGASCAILAGDVVNGCVCGAGPIRCGLALNGRSSKRCTTRTKDGQLVAIVKSAVPLRDAAGAHVGALESFTRVRDEDARPATASSAGIPGCVGRHPAMLELYQLVHLVAASPATVMILGESGTGKDRVAEAIHALGPRSARPLVRVSCARLDAALVAGPGGADPFDRARGGTLVLDELGDLGPAAQLELLRRVEQQDAARSAAVAGAVDDVRLLCTTHDDLRRAVDERRFRADLFFRLNVFPIRVPPLRERLEDVPALAEHVLARRTPPVAITAATSAALLAYGWPGNVRELENVLAFAALRSGGAELRPEHLPLEVLARAAAPRVDEKARLAEALARSGGSRTLAARALGISRVTLWKRLKKYGIAGERGD